MEIQEELLMSNTGSLIKPKFKNTKAKTAIKRINYVGRIFRNKILNKSEPIIVALTVNNACNLKCSYCFGDYYKRSSKNDFITEEIINICDELYSLGTRALTVHGGETLLRKDIGFLIDYMKTKGFYVNLITNGLLLSKKINDIRNVDSLCISLDGNEQGNDLNRGKGTQKKILEAIKLAKREGFRLRVQATITKHTADDIEYLAKLAKDIGFELEFSLLYLPVAKESNLSMDPHQVKFVLEEIVKYKKMDYPIFTSFRALENAINWPFPYEKSKANYDELPADFKKIDCYYGKTKMIIDADGKVYPCFPMIDDFEALNIKEVGVKKAFQHVRDANPCVACCHLTNNDHNLLLGLSVNQIISVGYHQIKEILNLY